MSAYFFAFVKELREDYFTVISTYDAIVSQGETIDECIIMAKDLVEIINEENIYYDITLNNAIEKLNEKIKDLLETDKYEVVFYQINQ